MEQRDNNSDNNDDDTPNYRCCDWDEENCLNKYSSGPDDDGKNKVQKVQEEDDRPWKRNAATQERWRQSKAQ